MADNPSEPATPMERMRTDRHIQEVDELCQRRRDEGRPWTARASPAGIPGSGKVVHFIRHGQAEHNALAAASGAPACHCKRSEPGGRDTPQASCPYNADAAFDAPLTATGRDQASDLADTCAGLGVQLVVSSPLRRTLQTALHAFGDFIEADLLAPVVAHEALREQHGMHRCDQRRDTVAIGAEFGVRVNVDGLPPTDTLWTDQRESKDHVADRCEEFATWLMEQPEDNIAVVAHHHVLLVLFHCVVECGDGGGYYEGLLKPFSVGEMRSLRVEIPTLEDQLALAEETAMAMDEEGFLPPARRKPMTWQNIADWDKQPPGAEGCEPPPPAPGWGFIPGKTTPLAGVPTGVPQTSGSSGGGLDAASAAGAGAGAGVGGGAGGAAARGAAAGGGGRGLGFLRQRDEGDEVAAAAAATGTSYPSEKRQRS